MNVMLNTSERLQIRQAAERLQREFEGRLNEETITRFIDDSLATLVGGATTGAWIPLLVERFARDRLRALVRLESDFTTLSPSVLFLCVHNAGRSQMAAGWMRHLAGDSVDVFSGGSDPAGSVNELAVAAMEERGIDIAAHVPQPWSDEIVRAADVIVTMGCGDACPVFPGKRYVDWVVEDPSGKGIEQVRAIRDDIEDRVRGLLVELGVLTASPGTQ